MTLLSLLSSTSRMRRFQATIIMSIVFTRSALALSNIMVTGANSGIGLALCKQLVKDHDVKIFLCARDPTKGKAAVKEVEACKDGNGDAEVEFLFLDVADDKAVQHAAKALQRKGIQLDAIVNNAGRGLSHGATEQEVMNVNFMGTKRVVDAFLPLLVPEGRIVNVGSGGGPNYVKTQPVAQQKLLCSPDITMERIEDMYDDGYANAQGHTAYQLSKALVLCYTMHLAKQHPEIMAFCVSPGFIKTAMTVGTTASAPPEQGVRSTIHCLFHATKEQSGWYFGSDALRSPLNVLRNPGEPEFDGVYPWQSSTELR